MSLRRIAVISSVAVTLAAVPAFTSRRPHYGGRLLVEIGAALNSLDPAVTPASPEEQRARLQIDSFIYDHRNPNGTFSDPGPFRVAEWEPGKHAVLAANDDYPRGRPFVDSVEIQMSRPAAERLVDIEVNKADIAEIPADQARRAADRGVRISASQPDELIALVFVHSDETGDPRAREALSRSIDRSAIVNFILQKQGEPAGGLLPQWSSGTAFLFPASLDLDRAKQLRREINPPPKIGLGYDAGDSLLQAIGERIVVNAREAGIPITTEAIPQEGPASKTAARLVRLDMPSPDPRATLMAFLNQLPIPRLANDSDDLLPDPATPQQIYDREAPVISTYSVIPIAWIPHVYALSPRVRDWTAPGPGEEWQLADVWLDQTNSQPKKETP
jgi:peptide/nickel transport system substrate-binding protein